MLGTKTLFMAFCALSEAKGMDIKMKQVLEEFGGALVYSIAGGSMLGLFLYLLEKLLG